MLCLIFLQLRATAQSSRQITGTVTEKSTNNALIGCSVSEKGTTNGVITDANGKFTLSVRSDDAVLLFAFIGYEPKEVRVGSQTSISVSLEENARDLQEVVVVRYRQIQRTYHMIRTVNLKFTPMVQTLC